uniref:Apple domain-containing protein n=1 Tax=Parascaris equorum TaxID=6256 RepID=A0A914R4K3_PAREQ
LFNRRTQTCHVSPIAIQNVYNVRKYFAVDPNVDLYESNCASYGWIFFFFHFHIRFSSETMNRACLAWTHGFCRSFTFDRTDSSCYLSHTTGRALGKNPLDMTNVNLSTGDLDDCFKCWLNEKVLLES